MILNRLTLVNFGVYRGEHTFDLRPHASEPIIIFGGKNGAGKTTLLNALRLCLHGPLALDEHTSRAAKQADYEQYLRERIHRRADGKASPDKASITLEFEYAVAGEREIYTVERSWEENGKRVKESLRVFHGPELMKEMDEAQWEDLIRDLVPPGLVQLFFFDGEKSQSLSNGSRDVASLTLSQAIKALLGVNLVEQLQADLSIYLRRQQKERQADAIEARIATLENDLGALEDEEKNLLLQIDTLADRIHMVEAKITAQEGEVARVGGGFAQERERYKTAQIRLHTEIETMEQAIRELCAGLLPFAITPAYTKAVENQLLREADYERWLASRTFIQQKLDEIQSKIESPAFWRGTGAEALEEFQQTIGKRVVHTLQGIVEPPESVRDITLRHHASNPKRAQLLQWIRESQTNVPTQLERLTTQLVQAKQDLDDAEQALQRVPADDVLGPLVETLNEYNQELGGLAQKERQIEEALHRLTLQREELERSLRRTREDQTARQKLATKMQQVVDVQLVLDDFEEELTRLRVSQLETALAHNFNQLCRKERLVQRVKIDPQTFEVTLVGMNGALMSHSELSAGEKQIYALALLWSLRQVSGRPLPIVIDAPLGRLDSDHRRNLVERYFPQASHQVIIFSTDTEVDAEFYATLQGSIAHAYHLDYSQEQKATWVRPGYFWRSNGSQAE